MKRRVKISKYSLIITCLSLGIMAGIYVNLLRNGALWQAYLLFCVMLTLGILALWYMPLSISVDSKFLRIRRSLRTKNIPLSEIETVVIFQPSMAEKRIFASGGWFGYWGWFSEKEVGKYFGYYGKASDCFLITLHNGQKYLLGCENPQSIVAAIKAKSK